MHLLTESPEHLSEVYKVCISYLITGLAFIVEYIHVNVHVLVEVVFRSDFFATNITSELWLFVNLKVTRFITSPHNFTTNGTRPVRFVFSFRFSFRFFCTVHCFKMGCQFSRVVEDFTTNFTW